MSSEIEMRRYIPRIVFMIVLAAVLSVLATSTASAAMSRGVDDDCKGTYGTPYFFAAGPAIYWYTNSSGVNGCHMWTTTIDYSLSPVNIAWWYTDPNADPAGTGSATANLTGLDNSCGYAWYGLMPSGDFGATNWYYTSQAGPGSRYIFSGVYFTPAAGAKIKLPDAQPCSVNSSIQVDYVLWTQP